MANDKQGPADEEKVHEIVLIRRRGGGDHEEHHGGVWKVAFADFMTAMMAFFLVLWIVNSTTKETRSSLARYFNPIRLSDTTPARKGLKDPKDEEFDAGKEPRPPSTVHQEASSREKPAGLSGDGHQPPAREGDGRKDAAIASSNPIEGIYQDPFAPSRGGSEPVADLGPSFARAEAAAGVSAKKGAASEARALADELARSLGEESRKLGDALEVTAAGDDLLISLTDRADFGMFAVGSAAPEPRLARAVEAISRALQGRKGALIVRGHTDARPFRGVGSDNWQLSSARAQAAMRMLVSGGIDERRIERVEGYADHRLRKPDAPDAPENRRIEILLRAEAS
jgi:chemotaxis protein MotB